MTVVLVSCQSYWGPLTNGMDMEWLESSTMVKFSQSMEQTSLPLFRICAAPSSTQPPNHKHDGRTPVQVLPLMDGAFEGDTNLSRIVRSGITFVSSTLDLWG